MDCPTMLKLPKLLSFDRTNQSAPPDLEAIHASTNQAWRGKWTDRQGGGPALLPTHHSAKAALSRAQEENPDWGAFAELGLVQSLVLVFVFHKQLWQHHIELNEPGHAVQKGETRDITLHIRVQCLGKSVLRLLVCKAFARFDPIFPYSLGLQPPWAVWAPRGQIAPGPGNRTLPGAKISLPRSNSFRKLSGQRQKTAPAVQQT